MLLNKNVPACSPDVCHGPSVDVGAHHPHDHGIEQVESAPEKTAFRAHVFEKQKSPARFTDPSEFLKPSLGIRYRTEYKGGEDRFKGMVGERKILDIHLQKLNLDSESLGLFSGSLQHPWAEVNGGDQHMVRVVGEVLSGTDTCLQGSTSYNTIPELCPPGGKPKSFHGSLERIIDHRQPVVSPSGMILVGGCFNHSGGLSPMPRAQDSMIIVPPKAVANPFLLLLRSPIGLTRLLQGHPKRLLRLAC